jgi:phosphate transport system substrate-binding protein
MYFFRSMLPSFSCKRLPLSFHGVWTFWSRNPSFFLRTVPLLIILVLTSCGVDDKNTTGVGAQNTNTAANNQVKVVGSTAMLPLVSKAADLFRQSHSDIQISVVGGGSLAGLDAVTNRKADIGDSDVYADPSTYPDPNLTDHIVCAVSFSLIVDPQITATSLSTSQIVDIFSGKTTNWKDVGGPNLAITTVVRPSSSGTRVLFEKYVLGGGQEVGTPIATDSSTVVLDQVAHTPGAIGYLTTIATNSTVQTLAIDGVSPTVQNIQAGKYKFWGYEHMYTLQNGVNATTQFLDFMQSSQVQQLAKQLGYISVDAVKSFSPTGSSNG